MFSDTATANVLEFVTENGGLIILNFNVCNKIFFFKWRVLEKREIFFDNEHQVKAETQRTLGVNVTGKELADKKKDVAYKSNFCYSSL